MAGRVGGPRTPSEQSTLPDSGEASEINQETGEVQPSMTPEEYLQSACRIDPNALLDTEALQAEYLRVTDDMHYYLPVMLDAIEHAALAKLSCDEVESIARLAIRRKNKEERISEATLDAEVTINPSVMSIRRDEIRARKQEVKMKTVFSIIREKASMLIQLGADMRQDRGQDLSIRERELKRER